MNALTVVTWSGRAEKRRTVASYCLAEFTQGIMKETFESIRHLGWDPTISKDIDVWA